MLALHEHATHTMGEAMGPSGKWIDGICADASVIDAGRLSLAARLTTVAHWLPLAAYHSAQDIEHVHRLRVSTRRAVAALRLYCDWLPPGQYRWVKKRLKRIRGAAGEARDLDVLAERLRRELGDRGAPILDDIQERRHAAQPAVVQVAEKCRRGDRFVRKVGKLVDGLRPPEANPDGDQPGSFGVWARNQLTAAAEPFFAEMPTASSDAAALHQFRIRGKALRYAIELLAPAFGRELRKEHYPVVEELQERLGAINDHVSAAARLCEWRGETDAPDKRELYDELIDREHAAIAERIGDFHQWWTPERAEALRSGLIQMTAAEPKMSETA